MSETSGIPVDVIDDHATRQTFVLDDPSQARELVLVGRQPTITQAHDGSFVVPPCGLVFKDEWERLEDFQSPMPPLPPNFPVGIIRQAMAETKRWNEIPYAAEADRKLRLNPEHTVRWKFDMLGTDKSTWYVDTATMGEHAFFRWTWGDARVVAPVLRAFCAVANFFYPLFVRKIRV
jgi:hypothetical protein